MPRADEPGGPTVIPRRIALATHYYASGPAFTLEAFLQSRVEELLFIAHPLFAGGGPSYARRYRGGVLRESWTAPPGPRPLRYAADVWRTIRWGARLRACDLFIGGDPLLAIAGIWLRLRRRTRRAVLYAIDYSPRRFENPVLNRIYHRVDRFVSGRVDIVWNLSPAIATARRDRDPGARLAPQLIVPLGTDYDTIVRLPLEQSPPPRLAFLGHLLEKQGLQLAIAALPAVRRVTPKATLLVIGDGPYRAELERLAGTIGARDAVEFTGFIEDHRDIERRLAACAIGLAPYTPEPDSFTRFADPGKVKTYLACGLPVILTNVPAIAASIEAAGAGQVVPYEVSALADAIGSFLSDEARLRRARESAARLGAEFRWDRIFAEAFSASARYLL